MSVSKLTGPQGGIVVVQLTVSVVRGIAFQILVLMAVLDVKRLDDDPGRNVVAIGATSITCFSLPGAALFTYVTPMNLTRERALVPIDARFRLSAR